MKLRIVTPLDMPVDEDGVTSLRAEDPTGSFGILQGHADFLTSLVTGGTEISITTREAITGTDLATLEHNVLARFQADIDTERAEKVSSTRVELLAIRQIVNHLNPAGRNFR